MNKKFVAIAMAAAIAAVSTTTVFAAGNNPAGGNTDVYVGVTQTTPSNISVTVPTTLAIAVVNDNTTVKTLMGNYMVDSTGKVTTSGDASQGVDAQRVTFINNSTNVAAKVVSAKIVNPYGSQWAIKTAPGEHELSMSFNSVDVGNVPADQNVTVALNDFALPAGQVTHMNAAVAAGGAVADYTSVEESAKAFVIEWNIEAQ